MKHSIKALKRVRTTEKIKLWIITSPVRFFITGLLLVVFILTILDYVFLPDFKDILVEAHGLIFDLIIFGILLAIYERMRTKKSEVEICLDELKAFKDWKEEEGILRKVKLIKQLNSLGVFEIDLSFFYLEKANLMDVNLEESNLTGAKLKEANFSNSKLNSCNFSGADLTNANFSGAEATKIALNNSILKETDFSGAVLNDSTIIECKFISTNLYFTSLLRCTIWKTSFKSSEFCLTKLKGSIVDEKNWLKILMEENTVKGEFEELYEIVPEERETNINPLIKDTVFIVKTRKNKVII